MKIRPKVLFVAENVTLAQVVRLKVLADSLDPQNYEVHFASSEFSPLVFEGTAFNQHLLFTTDKERVFRALQSGQRLYEKNLLERYLEADLALLDAVKPDMVIGDFRLSLAISAPLRAVPWASMINAYWSPYAERESWPVPDHPIVKILGEDLTAHYFPMAVPKVFAHFAAPLNRMRRRYGMKEIGSLLEVLCAGDHTLYPDDPELIPTCNLPPHHEYLGPIFWAPQRPLPVLPACSEKPLVYVTLGSSGRVDALPSVLEAVAALNVVAVVATAGRTQLEMLPANAVSADSVAGDEMARRAAVVVCNGGSSTAYQALREGTPVLGIASNFDQFLSMQAIERAGAGVLLKARSINAETARSALRRLVSDARFRTAAQQVAARFATSNAPARFQAWLARVLAQAQRSAAAGHR